MTTAAKRGPLLPTAVCPRRTDGYSSPHGTSALIPGVGVSDEVRAPGLILNGSSASADGEYVDCWKEACVREADDLLATRTVAARFPAHGTQYWLTTRVFSVGDTIERNGRTYVVSDVASARETGSELRITLEEVTAEGVSVDVEALDRLAWNLPAA
jgi:hypothetical protein